MTALEPPIGDDDLQAHVDGRLSPTRSRGHMFRLIPMLASGLEPNGDMLPTFVPV